MINDKQNLLPVKDYDSIINTYNKIIDEIESCLKAGDDCSNNFKLFLTGKMLKNVDNIIKQELSSELKEKFASNIRYNIINQNMGFKRIKEFTESIINQIQVHESKVKNWSEQSKTYYDNNVSCVVLSLDSILYTDYRLLEAKNIDILTYFSNTIGKISNLKTLSCYPDAYDFIVKYQGWIVDLIITPFLGSLYNLTLGQRDIIKVEKENNKDERKEQ